VRELILALKELAKTDEKNYKNPETVQFAVNLREKCGAL